MAASSSSSASHSSPTYTRYKVFLSFRGEDTRHTFTDHLYKALTGAGIRTFRDNEEIRRGQELKPEIETAVINSECSIVVLSESYADSKWCLNELSLIMKQRKKCGHVVLPVFYHVNPSDVRNQRGSFAIDGLKGTEDDVRRWKAALRDVANLSGMVLKEGSESDFITEVVNTVPYKQDLELLSTPAHLVGMETRVEVFNSWFENEKFNAIAICGMGGTGKTTLAKYIYNLNKQNFENSYFFEEIGKHYKHGLLELQKKLLKRVLGIMEIKISDVYEGTRMIKDALQRKKVLIVLDDIDDKNQLRTLLGTMAFGTQSKIIITTRSLDIDAWFKSMSMSMSMSMSWSCLVHKLDLLDDIQSIELLSWHAFGSKIPMEGFEDLARQLAQYCEGNPLALEVLGSSLFVNDEGQRNTMIEIWRERMESLNSSNRDLDCNIQVVLRKSFDSLQHDNHKKLFLDIACFFVGKNNVCLSFVENKDKVSMLRADLYPIYGITTLINKCLLTVSSFHGGALEMHQLLQDMGKKIVCDESIEPIKRSRVWNYDESSHILRKGEVSDTIEALDLYMKCVEPKMMPVFETSSLAKMKKLKHLRLKCVKLHGSYDDFPELRSLCWYKFPLKKFPSGLLMSSLVAIDMSWGKMKTFEAPTVLHCLKYLSLKSCFQLVSICNFQRLPKLETLILFLCFRLTHLCSSIGYLENLAHLDLTFCTQLFSAAMNYVKHPHLAKGVKALRIGEGTPEQPLRLPKSLMVLDPNYCRLGYKYDNLMHVVFRVQRLDKLCLWGNPCKYLSRNIDLHKLQILHLYFCRNLKSLLCMPSTLVELKIEWCTSLEKITFESGRFTLQKFEYRGCFELSEIQGLFKLVPVAKLDEADLGHMKWIKAYEDLKLDLFGDEITKDRIWHTQVLYEYGIMSTYLKYSKDQSMPTYDYMSSSSYLSFRVQMNKKKHKIQGLDVSCLYKLSAEGKVSYLLVKISNITKGFTWVYNPAVYGKPSIDEDVVWLSYWPIGSNLEDGDEVSVKITALGMMMISECGASLVYMDDGEVEKEENNENTKMRGEEVIGGDLSEFEVTAGGYYLCRRDSFEDTTTSFLKLLFGDNIDYTESLGWRKARQPWITTRDYEVFASSTTLMMLGRQPLEDAEVSPMDLVKGLY